MVVDKKPAIFLKMFSTFVSYSRYIFDYVDLSSISFYYLNSGNIMSIQCSTLRARDMIYHHNKAQNAICKTSIWHLNSISFLFMKMIGIQRWLRGNLQGG